jgi:hypothetical protein
VSIKPFAEMFSQPIRVCARATQQLWYCAVVLIKHRYQNVLRFDTWVISADREALCIGQKSLQACRHFVHTHGALSIATYRGVYFVYEQKMGVIQ